MRPAHIFHVERAEGHGVRVVGDGYAASFTGELNDEQLDALEDLAASVRRLRESGWRPGQKPPKERNDS